MTLTKKVEAEIRRVYQAYWDSYLGGDLKNMGGFLVDDFTLIGTSDGEVFNNKKSAMKYLKATIGQVAGVLSKKNVEIKITQVDDTILVSEFFDAYIKLDGTPSFYDKFRATTVMKRVRGKWKLIHQHGSLPDSKAEVGETLASEKVKKENRELREAVKRRTLELEQKNRDLEIEASLEKVRARAMAMQSSSELADLIGMIYAELTGLDINLNRCFIMLFDEPTGDAIWWMASGEATSLKRGYHLPFHKHRPHLAYLNGWKNQESSWKYVLKGDVKKKWDKFNFSKTELAQLPKLEIRNMKAVKLVYLSAAFNKYGCITTGTLEPLASPSFDLLARFSRMFEQTYTRFLDLQKAEAQARESQIQLALERVRARTMAMQHSDELQEASNLLFKQVQSLEIPVWSCGFNIWEKREKICTGWMSTNDAIQPPFKIPLTESPTFIRFYKSRKKNEDFYLEKVEGKALAAHYKYMLSRPDFARIVEQRFRTGFKLPKSQINHVANFAHGNLVFITSVPVPDAWDIFKRFAKVFEQTYTRFLDLKRAEAQAREAQIEIALEKIRGRSLAMHNSKELSDVIGVVFCQLNELKVLHGTVGIQLFDFNTKDSTFWPGNTLQAVAPQVRFPFDETIMNEDTCHRDVWQAMSTGKTIFNKVYTRKQKDRYFQYVFANNSLDVIFAESRKIILQCESLTLCFIPEKNSALYADSFDGSVYTDEEFMVLKRTAKVFEQAYIRFLDLEKAEAQAREAQIEAALEKVRSTSMGMHRSHELEKVVAVLFDKLSELGLSFDAALLFVFDKPGRNIQIWLATKHLPDPINVILPYDEEFAKNPVIEDLRRGEDIINKTYSGQAKDDYFRYTVRHNESKIPENDRKLFFELKAWTVSFAAEKNSIIAVDSWYGQTTTTENFQILKRFARVFEQAYVRFLDLQNAEAQAREAQIEAAMEKIRSRSLAMHRSDEVRDVVFILFKKLGELKVVHDTVAIQLFDFKTKDSIFWPGNDLSEAPPKVMLPFDEKMMEADTCHRDLWQAMANGEIIFNKVYSKEQKDLWFQYVFAHNDLVSIHMHAREFMTQANTHTVCFIPGKKSALFADSFDGTCYTEQEMDVLKRAARVFEQAYVRFLDLQNAEAQAREAQIQLALERLRARTMAMHQSYELAEAASVMFEQLSQLGVSLWICAFNICKEDSEIVEGWVSPPDGKIMDPMYLPYTIDQFSTSAYETWKNHGETYTDIVEGIELKESHEELLKHPLMEKARTHLVEKDIPLPTWVQRFAVPYKFGYLTIVATRPCEEPQIFVRFAKVFEQTYTRFLDLKNAEALARESQIQLALERVRARTMAMQQGDELKEVAMLLFKQVADLGINCWTTGFNVWSEDGDSYVDYVTNPLGGFMEPYTVDTTRFAAIRDVSAARKKGETFFARLETGDRQKETYSQLNELGDKDQYGKILESGFQFPSQQVNHFVFGEKVSLLFVTYDHVPEAHDIFKRFGMAFEQTYTRFLDLEKAEAQARESQIQLALERVRARTMAMQKSEELNDVAILLFQQVSQLGIKTWSTGFNVWSDDNNSYTDYIASPAGNSIDAYKIDATEFSVFVDVANARKRGDEFWIQYLDGDLLQETYRRLTKFGGEEQYDKILADGFQFPTRQYDHFVFGAKVSLMFITYDPVPEAHDIFKRFGKVFEQTYTRFLDLKRAEAQAREAQIEAALEKVRARTMGMQRSDELAEAAVLMFQQVKSFGLELWGCGFNIWEKDEKECMGWMSSPDGRIVPPVKIPLTEHPVFIKFYESRQKGVEFYAYERGGKELEEFYEYLMAVQEALKEYLDSGRSAPTFQIDHVVNFSHGNLIFITYRAYPEAHDIFKRFGKVFEQTYTRFLDLKKAEAQAREAHIEAALERVRSRTMAMHKSDELLDVITVVSEQLQHVGIKFSTVSFGKNNSSFDMDFWIAAPDLKQPIKMYAPYSNIPIYNRLREAYRERRSYFSDTFTAEETKVWNQHIIDHNPELFSEKSRGYLTSRPAMTRTTVLLKNVFLFLINYDIVSYSNEDIEIVIRFANVFEQTYTRFLDLQKAEEQAREAQIDAALERLRSRTMAMQRSTELAEVSQLLHQQFLSLGVQTITCAFMFPDEEKKIQSGWSVLPDGTLVPQLLNFPLLGDAILDERYAGWKEKRSLHRKTLGIEENRRHHQFLSEQVASHISKDIFSQLPDQLTFTNANFAQGYLMTFTTSPLAAEEENILVRFAKVFEQTYTRFLDLQRAEAQAREAEVQLALERVRARTMAMHLSSEVTEVAFTMNEQLEHLGFEYGGCTIIIMNAQSGDMEWWMGGLEEKKFPESFAIRNFDHPVHRAMLEGLSRGEKFKVIPLSGELKKSYDANLFFDNGFKSLHKSVRDWMLELPSVVFSLAYNKHGALHWGPASITGEQADILQRFANVFEQSYTRFLDLQKAEAQAREAQIESALEKIRSRSLAMHHSGELKDVVAIMFEKMKELKVVIGTIAIQLFDENTMNCIFWVGNNLHDEPPRVKLPYDEEIMQGDGYMKDCWELKMKGENLINKEYTYEQKIRFFDYVLASNDLATISEPDREGMKQAVISPSNGHIVCLINEKNSSVFADSWKGEFYSEESVKVLIRAAKVFEQAYVRFLDLQKAEAQARESQIEAALERVRAKTMAMHKSEELLDVIVVVSQQLTHLGFRFDVVSFARNSEMHDYKFWFCMENAQQAYEIQVPYLNNPMFDRIKSAMAEGAKFYADTLTVTENREWIEHMLAHDAWPGVTDEVKNFLLTRGYARSIVFMPQITLLLGNYFLKPYSEEQNNILKRFAAVFEQSYTRFLDLQKAEAQAREAQIETALERVRAKAMAMHTAEQLKEVVHELRQQLGLLELRELETCVIQLVEESPEFIHSWAAVRPPGTGGEIKEFFAFIPKRGLKIIEEWLIEYASGKQDYVLINEGEKLHQWFDSFIQLYPEAFATITDSGNINPNDMRHFWSFADFQGGSLLMVTYAEPNGSARLLLRRFANVFGLAYRRFADLKQAEAQAREAQIEVALERVRAKAMAMHSAQQLSEVVRELRTQMGLLGQKGLNTCVIHLHDESPEFIHAWAAIRLPDRADEISEFNTLVPKVGLAIIEEALLAYAEGRQDYVLVNDREKLRQWGDFTSRAVPGAHQLMVESIASEGGVENSFWAFSDFQGGSLLAVSVDPPEESSRILLRRFANVFGLAYRRFADLKKAEVQAREATIEAALEKIRSRSLGMHKSEEILDVVAILFEKLKELGLVFDGGAAIHLFSEGSRDATIWVMSPELSKPIVNNLPYDEVVADNPIIKDVWKAKDTGQHITNRHYSFEEKREYFEYVFKHNAHVLSEEVKDFIRSANSYTANFIAQKNSLLGASSWTGQIFSENDIEVLKRVAHVFEQAYIRFLDLQRTEAQAKEATIEAALEKIRSRSLGMHQSDELNDVVTILFEKLKELNLPFDGGAGLFLFSEGSRDTYLWVTNGHVPPVCNYLPYDEDDFSDNAVMQDVWKAKDTGKPIINKHYSSEEKNKLFSYTSKHNDETKIPEGERNRVFEANSYTATFIPEKNSLLSVDSWTKQIMSAGDIEVLKRVARVFEQAYVRFLDLQKAELHAKEAVCQASLDRVRAEIASMRTVEDLDRITPLIWRELYTIGIPFIRCGVFIMDEPNRVIQTFLSTPDGKAIAVFQLPFDTPGRLAPIVPYWQDKKIFLDYWDDVAKKDVADILVNRGIFSSSQQYLDTLPKEGFHLHCLPFAQGMLYVANLTQLKDEELNLLQSLADAFATAYARYDDFNKLESAKQQVDRTLVDLKQAQQQLVQSEKMASLGELTAGIAHEIQNPLNFVNNFSEVSNELIEEMKTELQAGNLKDAAELAESIKQNLEKITHHGKRADGIVKGMLQHSRAGSGQKEITDLNFLCDEYLRLAYHGYRAKDKSFNAKFEMDFDATLPKVNVVPQDMGRVILNLINNAFYAVGEKNKTCSEGYVPTVRVSTKRLGDRIEIQVGDNGPGIPASIAEKIFQPFFTTKPTGQGTGLGLSLAYDIVTKLHGGELKVETQQGEGCVFVITIPCPK